MNTIRFVSEGKGLTTEFGVSGYRGGERSGTLEIDAEVSRDHGLMTIPVRLPRHLMPEWSPEEWDIFIGQEIRLFHNFVDEAVLQCLSLAIVTDDSRRAEILRTANGVVIDFRGDLPNIYASMMLGGYKVGVYRSGHGWPIWLSIQPTYDLALKEAERIRNEINLPANSVVATGALSNFLSANIGPPLMSDSVGNIAWRDRVWLVLTIFVGVFAWFARGYLT
jgi:hypothetical protein